LPQSGAQKKVRKLSASSLDPRKDFRFFMMRAKVRQVYREALQEARGCPEGAREAMSDLIRDEFRVFRRDPADERWKLDSE
jgi:hypothetical protein